MVALGCLPPMSDFWVALGSLAGWLAFIVLVVGLIAVAVSWVVVRLAERKMRGLR